MLVINLTPHEIVVRRSGSDAVIRPDGRVARVVANCQIVGDALGVPVVRTTWGAIEGLPDPEPGVIYLVSTAVAQAAAAAGRDDVLAPDTGPESAVRDDAGRIIAVRRLQRF